MNRRQRRAAERAARKHERQVSAQRKKLPRDRRSTNTAQPTRLRGRTSQSIRRLGKAVAMVIAAIGVLGVAYQLRPRLIVTRDISLDVKDPFATQFRVTNAGELSLYDVRFSCVINNEQFVNVRVTRSDGEPIPTLESGMSATRQCSIKAESYPLLSELFVDIAYRPKLFWSDVSKRTRFVNRRDSDGVLQWFEQPTSTR
jgi:hypothetical protein